MSANSSVWSQTFHVDAWGNLGGVDTANTPQFPLIQIDKANRMQNPTYVDWYGYDLSGNLTKDGGARYLYDAENRLNVSSDPNIVAPIYSYDGDGNRAMKSVTGTVTRYWSGQDNNILAESNGTALASEYVFFGGKRIARRDLLNGAVRFYLFDHLGSTSVVTSEIGEIVDESDYYPYGGEHVIVDSDLNRYKFTGKERDTETGLDYFGARYYASNMGRFMSPDEFTGGPIDAFGGDPTPPGPLPYADITNPQSLNKYVYALNNPLRFIDPDGHDPQCPSCKTEYENEIKQGGTKNWRNNNPGNIVYGDFAKSNGAIGKDKDGFAIFPDAKSGKDAQNNLWDSKSYQERSITDATKRWTSGDPAEIQKKYAEDIAKAAGVSPDTKIKDLTPEQRQKLQDGQRKREGYQEGKAIPKKTPEPKKKEEQK